VKKSESTFGKKQRESERTRRNFKAMSQFTFHKEQQAFKDAIVDGYKKRIAVAAARRCGKSELIARTMIGIAATTKSNILIYAPTLQQTKDIYKEKFQNIFADSSIYALLRAVNETENRYTFHSGAKIILGSAENLKRREGVDWHYIVCDEASDTPPGKLPIDSGLFPALSRTAGVAIIAGV
jgi:phage terminase large subunit GpA-like protein